MTTLAEKASRLAGTDGAVLYEPAPEVAPIALDAPREYATPEQIPVHQAWNRVMQDVTYIKKTRNVTSGPAKFAFRGIEDVVQAFGASVRRHGVIVAPTRVVPSYTTSSSKSGTSMRECTVVVTWTVIGPMGDTMPVQFESAGEAADYSDKSTTKAQSIAERTLLVILGLVPTDDPEPELESADMVRGDARVSPHAYYAEITNPMTPRERFRQIYNELGQHRLVETVMEHEGEKITLGKLFMRVGDARWPRPAPRQAAGPGHDGHPAGEWADGCAGCIAESTAADQAAAEEGAS